MAERRDARETLLDAGLSLASELSLPAVLQRVVDLAVEVTGARYGALGVVGEEGQITDFVTHGISARQRKLIGRLPEGHGLLGYLIRHPRPLRLRDLAEHRQSAGFPTHHPPMKSFLGAPITAMGKVYGNIYLTEKKGGKEFTAEDERAIAVLAAQAGSAIANATLYDQMRARERWLDSLRTITGEILAGADTDSVLRRIARDARDLAGAALATIVSSTSIRDELVVSVAVGVDAARLEGQTVPASRSISGAVISSGKPRVMADAGADKNAFPGIVRIARIGPAIFVPLRVRGGANGTLMVANRKGESAFSERTVRLVETFADQASVAVEYSRAQADQRRLGLMDERERIAKELHDGVIQSLFAVGMGLQGTALMAPPDVSDRLERAVAELDRVIRDLRNYIFGLRPGILVDHGLEDALRTLGEEVAARSSLDVSVDVDPHVAAALSGRSHDIVQLTREALSNVVRHAHARHAWVRLAGGNGSTAVLTVEDDGVGFDSSASGNGNGLPNMRGRAASLQGDLRITSRNGKGTRLRLTVRS